MVAPGWYRRQPGPAIELRDVYTGDGRRSRSLQWLARYAAVLLWSAEWR